jgi:molybdopterin molybdotransferase
MLTPDAARAMVLGHARPLKTASLPLAEALGLRLAAEVRADRDLPPAARSSMDGYAVRHKDLRHLPCVLRVIGEVAAGSPARPRVGPGTCARVFTGANLPPGADAVVMVEQAEEQNGLVAIRFAEKCGANIRQRGEDARKGTVLLARGTALYAGQVGVCAAMGKASVRVWRRPRTTILCTGTELRSVDDRVRSHETRNSNGPALCAALALWGFPGTKFTVVADRQSALLAALRRAVKRYDVVLFTGGASVGAYDFVRESVEAAGATVRFHGVAMKPGKPSLYATLGSNRHVFGLPGNPLSALTAFHEFALPALLRLAGGAPETCNRTWRLPLAEAIESESDRVRCHLARLVDGAHGLTIAPVRSVSSADLVAAGHADGVILLPADGRRFPMDEPVEFRPWRPLP